MMKIRRRELNNVINPIDMVSERLSLIHIYIKLQNMANAVSNISDVKRVESSGNFR